MRIISGQFKGRKLYQPASKKIRPSMDKVREAVFSILQNRIYQATFLDAFAGSGAIGIEALSRGAKQVVFIEISSLAYNCIKKNLTIVDGFKNSELFKGDFLKLSASKLQHHKFDVIYLDPPFKADYNQILSAIVNNQLLAEAGLIISEMSALASDPLPVAKLEIERVRKYGDVKIIIWKEEEN